MAKGWHKYKRYGKPMAFASKKDNAVWQMDGTNDY